MLHPDALSHYPDALVEIYSQAEADILADMARRISTYDYFIPAAEWQFRMLQDMGNLHDEIITKLSRLTGKTEKELRILMEEAGATTLKIDDEIYRKAGLNPIPIAQSPALQIVLNTGLERTRGLFRNLTGTTAKTASQQFEQVLDRAYMQITTGAFDQGAAIRTAVKDLASKGLGAVKYPTGHVDYIETCVRRAVITGVNQTALQMQDVRAKEMGCDLVETSAHAGARPDHQEWQGKIFSRSGTHSKYPDFRQSTGYGTGPGLGGWNCRHSYYPFFEGISKRAYTQAELDDMEAPKYDYNGKKLTEYEATSQQRYIERRIRRWKREYIGMTAAGQPTDEATSKIAFWQRTEKDFLKQTGLKQQTGSSQVGGYGKSEAAKVSGAVRVEKHIASEVQKAYNIRQDEVRKQIRSADIPKSLNLGNQNKHIRDSKGYILGRSYIYGDLKTAQGLVDQYHGTGELKFRKNGEWAEKEFISLEDDIGVCIDPETGTQHATNRFSIHYGRRGTHIVPAERKDKK